MKLVTGYPEGWTDLDVILIHTSVKLVTCSLSESGKMSRILIHTSVKLVTEKRCLIF